MDYSKFYDEDLVVNKGFLATELDFRREADQAITNFGKNRLVKSVENGTLQVKHYHLLLSKIFHQVYYSSTTFSLAASRCNFNQKSMRDYLIVHAEEERFHWTWILNDLQTSGYKGEDPRTTSPDLSTVSYFSYAHFLAMTDPGARLAMAYVLEGISAKFGVHVGKKAIEILNLTSEQATFFIGHGELDQGHSKEVLECLIQSNPTDSQWALYTEAAKTTAGLYQRIYDEVMDV